VPVPDVLSTVLGTLAVLTVLLDVFYTVLFPASGKGPVRKPLAAAVWQAFRALAGVVPESRRRALLTYAGPVQVLLTMLVWGGLLLVGWALVYLPALGGAIHAASGPTDTGFATALYYSGFTLTTLGTGDIVADTEPYRLLTIVQAATGFAVMTMVITYFLSVYSSLPSRNAFALELHQRTRGTDDAAVLVAVLLTDAVASVTTQLNSTAGFLRDVAQTHRSYPVLRAFHYREDYYALPRLLLTSLETVTLIRSTLDPEEYGALLRASALDEMAAAARSLLDDLVRTQPAPQPSPAQDKRWRHRQQEAARTMADNDVAVRSSREAEDDYVALRARWDADLARLADSMLYRWDPELTAPGR
jgi:hypothetical protein